LVLEWAWSGHKPFGVLRESLGSDCVEIFGLAICQYPGKSNVYRFCCDRNWESEQDAECDSVASAKANLPSQYEETEVDWMKLD